MEMRTYGRKLVQVSIFATRACVQSVPVRTVHLMRQGAEHKS